MKGVQVQGRIGGLMVGGRRQRRRRRLVSAVVLVACALVGAAVAVTLLRDRSAAVDVAAEPGPELDPGQREAADVARSFLDAWAAEDWPRLGTLVSSAPSPGAVDPAGVHAEADRALQIAGAVYQPGEPEVTGATATVPVEATWTLEGLGEVRFATTLELVRPGAGATPSPSDAAAATEEGAASEGPSADPEAPVEPSPLPRADTPWLVDWSHATLHPELDPNGRFVRIRDFGDRAPILAADGTPLASSSSDVQVGVEPQRLDDPQVAVDALSSVAGADAGEVAATLAGPDLDPAGFYPFVTLPRDRFEELRAQLEPVPGIVFRGGSERALADPETGRRIVGRVTEATAEQLEELGPPYAIGDVVGASGIERAHERQLAGEPTLEAQIVDPLGLVESLAYREGTPGQPVQTTLDLGLQAAAEAALSGTALPSALVVVDATTGEIRGAANSPADGAERALSGRYPPGSTFKVVTATGMLTGGATVGSTYECPGSATLGGREIGNAGGFDLGTVSFLQAFARSCNTTFGAQAIALGADAMTAAAETHGFNVEYDLGLAGAFGGSYPRPESDTELGASGIGQARVEASPAHMASVAAAAASGTWRAPHVVRGPEVPERPLPPGAPEQLREMMRAVVTDGTGTSAEVPGEPPVIGKSGTAQFGTQVPLQEHAWFVAARGHLAVAAFVEGGGGGGRNAGPIAGRFFSSIPPPPPIVPASPPAPAGSPAAPGSPAPPGSPAAPG